MIVKSPARPSGPLGRTFKIAKGYGKAIMLEWASFSAGRPTDRTSLSGDLVDRILEKRRHRLPWLLAY
jgi:hypothetical protein